MRLTLSTENPDLPRYKCLALGIFADEKPPRGIGGFIDWRLNGMISSELKQGRLSGAFEEKAVIPFPQRVGAEMLFMFGLGSISDINYDKIYNAGYIITEAIDKMGIDTFGFDLFGQGRATLVTSNIVEAMVTGIFDFLAADINKLAGKTACIITSPANLTEVSAGIKQFKNNVNDKGAVDIGELENRLF